jgi:hypothetical protein
MSQHQPRTRSSASALALAIVCSLAATWCGPQVATPLPEPPSIDGRKIGPDLDVITVLSEPHPLSIVGEVGAVTPGSVVRVLNLDETSAAVSAQAGADGAFEITVMVSSGDELRFQAVQGNVRSEPVDFIHGGLAAAAALTPSPRHACVVLQPGLELRYDELGPRPLRVLNDCAEPLSLAAPRFRLGEGEFEIDLESESQLPLVVPPGSEATLDISLLELPPPAREDVLFIDFSVGGETIRYPIGLYAPAPTD